MPKQSTIKVEKAVETEEEIYHNVDILVNKSHESLAQMEDFSQEDVDKLCQVIEKVGEDNARYLAQMAVDETGRGKVEDKVTKNTYASQTIWESMKDMKTVGVTLHITQKNWDRLLDCHRRVYDCLIKNAVQEGVKAIREHYNIIDEDLKEYQIGE